MTRSLLFLLFLISIGSVRTLESQTHFVFKDNTGNNSSIAIPASAAPNISGVPIESGDEIGIFTPSGLCVGAVVWNGANTVLTCWGDNDQTVEIDGLAAGERMQYRLWQSSSGVEFKSVKVTFSEGDSLYHRNGIYILSSFIIEGTVTIEAECLVPGCIPDSIAAMASFSFCQIIGSPVIETIGIRRSGTACDADVPKARLYRDMNRNNIIDAGDLQLDTSRCFNGGNTCFESLNYSPAATENLLIVFEIAPGAELSNTINAVIDSNDVIGGTGTDVIFRGVTTPIYPLHLGIIEFSAAVKGEYVTLMWKNASEVNTYGFSVKRIHISAADAVTAVPTLWNEVVFIERIKSSSGFQQYSYTDARLANGRYGYRLKHIDRDGKFFYSEMIEVEILPPITFTLEQNYPNPFNPSTTIRYSLPFSTKVNLTVHDVLGRKIATLVNEEQSAGWKEVEWNGRNNASGIYFYRLQAGRYSGMKKLMIIK